MTAMSCSVKGRRLLLAAIAMLLVAGPLLFSATSGLVRASTTAYVDEHEISTDEEIAKKFANVPADATSDPTPKDSPAPLGEDEIKLATNSAEKMAFATQMDRLMDLLVNSLYKSKEIYLRELISNANDALDKIRLVSLTNKDELKTNEDLKITITFDSERKTITITDTGIGMTKEDLIKNLGTIAKSGTKEFINAVNNQSVDSSALIGQFGVGFYSAYLCAQNVVVVSKNNRDDQYIWESGSITDYKVVKDPRGNTLGRGTQITLFLKDECHKYLNQYMLKQLINKYSQYINFPIYLWTSKTAWKEAPADSADETTEESQPVEEVSSEDDKDKAEDDEKSTKKKGEKIEKYYWDLVNKKKPIWIRDPSTVTTEEYDEFYKAAFKDANGAMYQSHFKAEGDVEFKAILFVPEKAPGLGSSPDKSSNHMRIYLKHVFITDELSGFMPRHLSFLKGMIDSDNLPINVNRDQLQQSKVMKTIKNRLVSKALDMIKSMTKDHEKYDLFFDKYGDYIKLGVIDDPKYRKKIAKLLRFKSTFSPKEYVSLDEYVSRMKKGQKQIYFFTGPDIESINLAPAVENMVERGFEVLYFVDPVDEYMASYLTKYNSLKLQSVGKDGVEYVDDDDEVEKEAFDALKESYKPLTDFLAESLGDYVDSVKITKQLTTAPCAVLAQYMAASGAMERILKAQAIANDNKERYANLNQRKVFDLNPHHPVIKAMLERYMEGSKESAEDVKQSAYVLFESFGLASGFDIRNARLFSRQMEKVVRKSLRVPLDAKAEVNVPKAEEEDPKNVRQPEEDVEPVGMGMEDLGDYGTFIPSSEADEL